VRYLSSEDFIQLNCEVRFKSVPCSGVPEITLGVKPFFLIAELRYVYRFIVCNRLGCCAVSP
jgi:hypothetical protein